MKILIACEFSGIVRDAFTARGHDATSCDLLPSETPGKHFQGDVMKIIDQGWDMMIAHPPCTVLSYAGNKYANAPGRDQAREKAMDFFLKLWNAPIEKICIENPLGYPIRWRNYDQILEPYFFGDAEKKRTCIWLKNLPPLICTAYATIKPVYIDKNGEKRYRTDALSGHQQKERSRFFPGIARAMAEQWG